MSGTDRLRALALDLVSDAQPGEQVEVILGSGSSTSVRVHGGDIESITSADSSGAGVRVVRDGRLGFAHCGTLAPDVLAETLREARDNARFGEPDESNGLAEPDGVAAIAQDTWNDAVLQQPVDQRVAMALDLERRALSLDPRITGTRTTAYGDGWAETVIVSSLGVDAVGRASHCSVATQVLSSDGDQTQTGAAHDVGRDPSALDLDRVAAEAVDRATRLLGATKPATARMRIVLEPRLAMSLLGIVSGMLSGDAVVKGRSPFADRVGELVASPLLTMVDDPTRPESLGADETDGEGLACRPNPLIVRGELMGFLRDSTTGRRMGLPSTGSAVRGIRSLPHSGAQVLVVEPGTCSVDELLASTELGLSVNSFAGMHSGVNPVSGDFSVGADGLMIRAGELAEPVRELTIASTIQRLLSDIAMIGSDAEWLTNGDRGCSIVIDDVAVSGT